MNWRVSAGPTIDTPGVSDTGPCMWTLRMPSRFSSPLAVALPISFSESMSDCGGRSMSLVVTGGLVLWLVSGIQGFLGYQHYDLRLYPPMGMAHGIRAVQTDDALRVPRLAPITSSAALRRVLGRDWLAAWLFLLPCVLVLLGLIGYPFVSAILLSFQAKLVGTPGVWVGLQNYEDLLVGRDLSAQFLQSVRVSFLFTLVATIVKFFLGMSMALLLHEQFPGRTFIRALF